MTPLLLALLVAAPRIGVEASATSRGRYVVAREDRVRGLALPAHSACGLTQRARLLPDGSTEITVVSEPLERVDRAAASKPDVDPEAEPAEVRSLAEEIVGDASEDWDASRRIVTWVSLNVAHDDAPGISAEPTAVLAAAKASCVGRSELACALLRASGIPARTIHGLLVTGTGRRAFELHRWIESWIDDLGWVPSDPGDSVLCLDARHVFASTDEAPYLPESQSALRLRLVERARPLASSPGAKALVIGRRPEIVGTPVRSP